MKHQRRAAVLYVIGIAVVVLIIGAGLNAMIIERLQGNLLFEFSEQEALIAGQVAQKLQDNVTAVRDKLSLVASFPEIQSGGTTACTQKLEELYTVMEAQVGNLGRVGADGRFTCSLNRALVGMPAAQLGSYIPQIFNDPKHQPVLSRSIVVPGAPGRLAAVHVPVYDAHQQFTGTVGGAIYFSQLESKYLKDITFADNGFVSLIDDNGDILYHPSSDLIGKNIDSAQFKHQFSDNVRQAIKAAAATGRSGEVQYQAGAVRKLAAYNPVEVMPGHRWIVSVSVPVNDAESALTDVGLDKGLIAIMAVFVLSVIVIAGVMLRSRLKSLEVDQAKDEFLSLATHQLQTPLTGTRMVLSTLLTGASGKLNAEQREFLTEAYDACQRENRIVQDLLNVARADSGRLKLKLGQVELKDLIEDIVREQQPMIKQREQAMTMKVSPVTVQGDAARLRMVFENLLSNASKYTQPRGHITVELGRAAGKATVTVRDTGVGISSRDIPKLFSKFGRIPNELSDQVGGTGLGLYLVKQIVELHGGRVKVVSKPGRGSSFSVELPV